ncbi:hypothetical protein AB6A40_007342 [Gnathostoma spinigerum]|uniref:Zinc transporter ZIP11 n=1 Tax=Gnathostoma spinigerum TaxID=75299 RepID=A0ABD6EKX9_9BILA
MASSTSEKHSLPLSNTVPSELTAENLTAVDGNDIHEMSESSGMNATSQRYEHHSPKSLEESSSVRQRRGQLRKYSNEPEKNNEGSKDSFISEDMMGRKQALITSWRRILLLIVAVTVHNIPEGLAVGVAFGSVGKASKATFESALNLALGIGLQNFPEGLAVSLPLVAFGHGKFRSFFYGQLSGMVEPVAALAGAAAVIMMEPVLPYALSFAAGAMIFVVVDDIIPEAQRNNNGRLASISSIVGFLVMMSLDVALG